MQTFCKKPYVYFMRVQDILLAGEEFASRYTQNVFKSLSKAGLTVRLGKQQQSCNRSAVFKSS